MVHHLLFLDGLEDGLHKLGSERNIDLVAPTSQLDFDEVRLGAVLRVTLRLAHAAGSTSNGSAVRRTLQSKHGAI